MESEVRENGGYCGAPGTLEKVGSLWMHLTMKTRKLGHLLFTPTCCCLRVLPGASLSVTWPEVRSPWRAWGELIQVDVSELEGDNTEDRPASLEISLYFCHVEFWARSPTWGRCTLDHRQDFYSLVFSSWWWQFLCVISIPLHERTLSVASLEASGRSCEKSAPSESLKRELTIPAPAS